MLKKYLDIAHIDLSSEHFLFKAIYRSKDKCGLIYKNKKLSYSAAKTSIVSRLKLVASDLNFGLHSMRAGGATSAANSAALSNDRCWKRHGRWKSETSKDGYVKDSVVCVYNTFAFTVYVCYINLSHFIASFTTYLCIFLVTLAGCQQNVFAVCLFVRNDLIEV